MDAPATDRFRLAWDGAPLSFAKATGLDTPGTSVTLNDGHFLGGMFWQWFDRIKSSRMQRMAVPIYQCDEHGVAFYRWILQEAWPVLVIAAPGIPLEIPGLSSLVFDHNGIVGSPLHD